MRTFVAGTILVFCCLAVGCGLQKYISVRHNVAVSEGMAPTIRPGDHFASVGMKNDDLDKIERFNIVVFRPPKDEKMNIDENTRFVSRVVGLGGEKLEIKRGIIYVNDQPLDETSFEKYPAAGSSKAVVVPPNEFFLLGDNRPNSMDSRYIGTIKREDVDGKIGSVIRKEDYDTGKRW